MLASDYLVKFHTNFSSLPFFSISAIYTFDLSLMMLHCFPTEIAVKILSPVAIIVLMFAALRVSIETVVGALSLFYMIKNPRKVMLVSASSLFIE